jgi:hypothetical protein
MNAPTGSDLRIEKQRNDAILQLTTGETVLGKIFTSSGTLHHSGPERVGDLLNGEPGFFPFEVRTAAGLRTAIFNRAHIVTVMIAKDEPREDPGYAVATSRSVSMLLSTGQRLSGVIRIHQPDGHTRLSDWLRSRDQFHYVESEAQILLVNGAHIVEVSEVFER